MPSLARKKTLMANKNFGKEYFNSGLYKSYKKEADRWVPKTARKINRIIGGKGANPAPKICKLGAPNNHVSRTVSSKLKSNNVFGCGARILDIGCAHGYLIAELQNKYGHFVRGIDFSSYAIKNSEKTVRKNIIQGDILHLPFKKNSFDAVICLDVINYLEENETPKAICGLANISNKHIFFGAIFKHSWTAGQKWNPDKLRKSVLAKKDYVEMFEKSGARLAGSFDGDNGGSILVFKKK